MTKSKPSPVGRGLGQRSAATPNFPGYPQTALPFLTALARNNEKSWFEANRATYEAAIKAPTSALIDAVSAALSQRELPLEGTPKRSPFRIHRDVRFSKDKSPYKTNIGTVWYRQGSGKDGAGILYFHLAPTGCFAATAFYMPDPEVLGAIRERIRVHPGKFHVMNKALLDRGLVLDTSESLSRMPKGFEDMAAAPVAPFIRFKSYIVRRALPDAIVQSPALIDAIVDLAADSLPLLHFGWAAMDEARTG